MGLIFKKFENVVLVIYKDYKLLLSERECIEDVKSVTIYLDTKWPIQSTNSISIVGSFATFYAKEIMYIKKDKSAYVWLQ